MGAEPEARLARALEVAWRHLDRRERTVEEMRRHLERREIESAAAEAAIASLCEDGYLDDVRYARRLAEDKRRLEGWGRERIVRDLRARGVDRDQIAEALGDAPRESELGAALAVLERRFPAPPDTHRDQRRALGMLVRKGYDAEVASDAIRCYLSAATP